MNSLLHCQDDQTHQSSIKSNNETIFVPCNNENFSSAKLVLYYLFFDKISFLIKLLNKYVVITFILIKNSKLYSEGVKYARRVIFA